MSTVPVHKCMQAGMLVHVSIIAEDGRWTLLEEKDTFCYCSRVIL
jgi:hypothetical protein